MLSKQYTWILCLFTVSIVLLLPSPVPLLSNFTSSNDPVDQLQIHNQIQTHTHTHTHTHHDDDDSFLSLENNDQCNGKVLTPHFLFHKKIESYTNSSIKDYKIKRGKKTLVNTNEKTYARKHLYPTCTFKKHGQGPTPVLFLVSGRSGSSNTWLTLSKLAGKRNEALETVGSGTQQIEEFFKYLGSEEKGSWWVTEHLCEITNLHCDSAIAGFQWKPYGNSLATPAARGLFKEIASFSIGDDSSGDGENDKKIPVLYMTRNPIDVMISREKHDQVTVSAHCARNDKKCMNNHKSAVDKIHLPTKALMKYLKKETNNTKDVERTLSEAGINYFRTTYEKLYNSKDAEEWMKIFQYLGRGPTHGLTLDTVEKAFPYAKTTKRSREQLLSNFQEIKLLLQGTEFEHFLYE